MMKKVIPIIVLFFIFFGSCITCVDADNTLILHNKSDIKISAIVKSYTNHSNISINGNSQFTLANGVTGGTGTTLDPYIIDGWEIDAKYTNLTGIRIENTNANFIIRDCFIHNGLFASIDGDGIKFIHVDNGVSINNNLTQNFNGFRICASKNISILNNQIFDGMDGIGLYYTNNTIISNNSFVNNSNYGCNIVNSNNNIISYNTFFKSMVYGIFLQLSSYNNILLKNYISDSGDWGISICTNNCVFWENNLQYDGIMIGGFLFSIQNNLIPTNNTVNGKPIYYFVNNNGLVLNRINAGQIILLNCTKSIISNVSLNFTDIGICLTYCNNITIKNSTILNNYWGIWLYSTNDTMILGNNISNNNEGIFLNWASSNRNIFSYNNVTNNTLGINIGSLSMSNIITHNEIMGQSTGIVLDSYEMDVKYNDISNNVNGITIALDNHIIMYNNISRNKYGIIPSGAFSLMRNKILYNNFIENINYSLSIGGKFNSISHNVFINNNGGKKQAYDNSPYNFWNTSGMPHGYGNNWSEWYGPDNDSNGIVDFPYFLDGGVGARDYYPIADWSKIPESPPPTLVILLFVIVLIANIAKKRLRI